MATFAASSAALAASARVLARFSFSFAFSFSDLGGLASVLDATDLQFHKTGSILITAPMLLRLVRLSAVNKGSRRVGLKRAN